MFYYYNKQLFSALELVLSEFDANRMCQVSLVIKYRLLVLVRYRLDKKIML